jgi:hypothetical protein
VGAKRLEITLGRCKRPPQVLCSHGVWCTSLLRLAGTYGSYLVLTCRFAHFSCHIYPCLPSVLCTIYAIYG